MFSLLYVLLFLFRIQKLSFIKFAYHLSYKRNISISHFKSVYKLSVTKTKNECRSKFLTSCLQFDITPKFLFFKIPQNNKFDRRSVSQFQSTLLQKEIKKCDAYSRRVEFRLQANRNEIKSKVIK